MRNIDFKDIDKELEVIDIGIKGNLVRFYLGKKEDKWGWTNPNYKDYHGETPDWLKPSDTYYGDDWDDAPYDCNAGPVYDEFIKGYIDIAFDFECQVLEPQTPITYKYWSKDDMRDRKIPCLIILAVGYEYPEIYYKPDENGNYVPTFDFLTSLEDNKVAKIYFGDNVQKILDLAEREDM